MADKWVVSTQGEPVDPEDFEFEVSIVLDSFTHGKESTGWAGTDKIIILDGSNGNCDAIVECNRAKELAERIAVGLNHTCKCKKG